MTQITSGRVKLAEYARSIHVAVAPHGVSLSAALAPVFWAHVAQQIKPWDRIELRAEDDSWYADLIVFRATRLEVHARVLNAIDTDGNSLSVHHAALSAPEVKVEVPAGYTVDYGGPVHKYRVVRQADGQVLTHGLSEAEAVEWARQHAADANSPTKPVASTEPAKRTARTAVVETDATRAAVDIPDNWRDLSWQERRSLASKFSPDAIHNGEEANAAIEAELAKRAA